MQGLFDQVQSKVRKKAIRPKLYVHDWSEGQCCRVCPRTASVIFADPPYNFGYKYADDPTEDRMDQDDYHFLMCQVVRHLSLLLKPGGWLFWVCPAGHAKEVRTAIEIHGRLRLYGESERSEGAPIIWYEPFAQYQDKRLTEDYRLIFLARKVHMDEGQEESIYTKDHREWKYGPWPDPSTFNGDSIRIPSARQMCGDKRANPKGRVPGMVWQFRRLQGTSKDRMPWHPCQLPPELLDRVVLGFSNPGDLVVDPFVGSGSTMRACMRHGRRFVGFDRSPTYIRKLRRSLGHEGA